MVSGIKMSPRPRSGCGEAGKGLLVKKNIRGWEKMRKGENQLPPS